MDTSSEQSRLPHVWPPPGTTLPNARLTWDEWCARQTRYTTRRERPGATPFSDRELAHLRFVRWLHRSGHIAA